MPDRIIGQAGAIPLVEDLLETQVFGMVGLGRLARLVMGDGISIDGLECLPTTPASLSIIVNPGLITQPTVVDAQTFGTLAANPNPLLKIGVNVSTTQFTVAAPQTLGQSIAYMLCATFQEVDNGPVVAPYYNAANPAQPYSGPGGGGAAINRYRRQLVDLQVIAGAPARTGPPNTTPRPAGGGPLYVITVSCGQTAITAASISQHPQCPAAQYRLPQLTPGFSRYATFGTPGTYLWTVPNGVNLLKGRVVGAGGGAGAADPNFGGTGYYLSGAGGGAGGYDEGIVSVTPGQQITIIVGAQGTAGSAAALAAGTGNAGSGGTGGTSSIGPYLASTGGQGGSWPAPGSAAGGRGGAGYGGAVSAYGGDGSDGQNGSVALTGNGAASIFGAGGRSGAGGGLPGQSPGSGGGGGRDVTCDGGPGAPGLVILEY